jgi:hypothetical protein
MAELVAKIVLKDSFDATNTFRSAGQIGSFDPDRLNGEEDHLQDVGGFQPAIVQIAPIAPTGPNPTAPQQIPPDAVQTPGGGYALPGKVLVGEVTLPGDQREAQSVGGDENKVTEMLEKAQAKQVGTMNNDDDALVEGTVADVTSGINADTDLDQLEAAEKDREKPRAGVLNAIKAERARRDAE